MDEPPRHLIVIGAGPDGLAVAQALRQLGSSVTVLADREIFSKEDEELSALVRAAFAREGLAVREGVRVLRIEPRGDTVRVLITAAGHEKPVTGSHILLAAGRAPAVAGLGLSVAGVRHDENGIIVNENLVTSNPRIIAIGSVVRGARGEGCAERDAFLVLHELLGLPSAQGWRPQVNVRVIWTSPAIATAGLSESQARAAHRHIAVLRWPYAETERGCIEHGRAGHVKLVASQEGVLLGAGIAGFGAEELINVLALAISRKVAVNELAAMVVSHPSLASAVRAAAALQARGDSAHRPVVSAASRSIAQTLIEIKELGRALWTKAGQAAWRAIGRMARKE
jgi:pyruvate/2-oxoglutarate dehydrogenase complex dihydrolipoamide dehydrogenase (E3) component